MTFTVTKTAVLIALILATLSFSQDAQAKRKVRPTPTPTPTATPAPTATPTPVANNSYYSALNSDGYIPREYWSWNNMLWKVSAGSTQLKGMDHSIRLSAEKKRIRFEVRDTADDNSGSDGSETRRSEIVGMYNRLQNGSSVWGAFSFKHHPWSDPAGMLALNASGVYGQIHMGSTFGGSPALAFRRAPDGQFRITTRGEYNTDNTTRYRQPLSFGQVHDIVYNLILHPTNATLKVWLNGVKIVDISGESIGATTNEAYFQFGIYHSAGISGDPLVAEYGNLVYPSTTSLLDRVTNRPTWPND